MTAQLPLSVPDPTKFQAWRKKPVVIYATQVGPASPEEIERLMQIVPEESRGDSDRAIAFTGDGVELHGHIETLEGRMRFKTGDWILRGVQGEWYPCKDAIFEETYEPASDLTMD